MCKRQAVDFGGAREVSLKMEVTNMPVVDMVRIEKHYAGQWVALSENRKKVVASGPTLKETLANAHKKGIKDPILSKVPREFLAYIL